MIDKQGKHVATNLHGESLAKAIELLLDGKTIESINGSAGDILASAKKQAAQEKKLIFLHFGADWCVPCKVLEDWMSQPEVKALFDKAFIDVKIDMDNNYGAQELLESLTSNAGGIPWFAILNSTDDKPVASCEDGGGSAGVPDSDEGYDRFTKMFESTGKLKVEELSSIRSSISKVVEDFKAKSSK